MLINARGTGEPGHMQSFAYRLVNGRIMSQLPGGTVYNVDYAAGFAQMSAGGTADVSISIHLVLQVTILTHYKLSF